MSEQTIDSSLLDSLLIEDASGNDMPPEELPNHKATRPNARERAKALLGDKANSTGPKTKERVPVQKKNEFVEPLTEMYTMIGVVLTPFDQHCGPTIISAAPTCAQSLNDLAEKNENVRKALRQLTQASAMGTVIMAHAPIVLAIMSHHMPGSVPSKFRIEDAEESDAQ